MIDSSFIRFLMVGIANTSVGYGTIMLLHYAFGIAPIIANIAGYLIGGLLSYTLNRHFTFASKRRHSEALPRFALTVGCCFLLNLIVLEQTLAFVPLPVAQAFASVAYTGAFYLASRFLVFHPHTKQT